MPGKFAIFSIFLLVLVLAGCAEEAAKLAPGRMLPPKLHVDDSNSRQAPAPADQNNLQAPPDVNAALVSADRDFAAWNDFAPGRGINTSISDDFAWKLTLRLPPKATITGITISNSGTKQKWSTKAGAYPLVVIGPNVKGETAQLTSSYGQTIGPYAAGGTYNFMAYGQPEADAYGDDISPFNGGDVTFELADKTVLKGYAKKSGILPVPEPPQNGPVDYKIVQERDILNARFPAEVDIDETIVIAQISPATGGGSGFISISRNGAKPEKILEGESFEVKRRAYSNPYMVEVGAIGSDSEGNVRAVLYMYKTGSDPR